MSDDLTVAINQVIINYNLYTENPDDVPYAKFLEAQVALVMGISQSQLTEANETIERLEGVMKRSIDFLNAVHPPNGIVEDVIVAFQAAIKE